MSDYIPPELISNILARLPVDDVLRCTSVCKSWYSLITSPSFASLHLNLSSSNQEPRLLVSYLGNHRDSFRVHRDSQTFDEIAELYPPINRDCQIIDSLNGLVCLYDIDEPEVVLWNPSIRKSLILPKPRVFYRSLSETIGFSFVPSSNDYKVVWLSYPYDNQHECEAKIYQLSTGSWRDLKLGDFPCTLSSSQQAHYNGILHWYTSYFIFTFDPKDEKFGALMLPSCVRHDDSWCFDVSTFKKSLCLLDYDVHNLYDNIWVMKEYGVADSWEKLFLIDKQQYGLERFLCFRYNGELLYKMFSEISLGKQGVVGVVSYDYNSNQVENVKLPAIGPPFSVDTYVDSLVLIKSPNDAKESTKILKNMRGITTYIQSTKILKNIRGLLLYLTNKIRERSKNQ